MQAAGPRRIGRVTAAVSVPAQIAPIVGPLVGGLIVESVSWRWCFFLNVPVCLLAAGLAHRLVPAVPGQPAQRLDVRGLAMLAPALGALVYGLSHGMRRGFGVGVRRCSSRSSCTRSVRITRSSTCGSSRSARSRGRP